MFKTKTKKSAWLARLALVLSTAIAVQIVAPFFESVTVEARIEARGLGYTRTVTIPINPPINVEITEGNPPDLVTRAVNVHQVSVEISTNLPASVNTQFTNNAIYVRSIPSDLHQGPIVFNAEGIGTMNATWQADNSIRITAQDLTNEVWIRNHVTASGQTPRIIATLAVAPREGNVLTTSVIGNGSTSPTGSHIFANNEQVSISALPAAGAEFIAWRGPDSHLLDNASSAHTFFPSSATTRNLNVTAEFRGGSGAGSSNPGDTDLATPTPRTITVQSVPQGWSVLVSNSTPASGNSWTVNSGTTTTVQLVRTGATSETFQSWSADNVSLTGQATNPVISFTMPNQNIILIPTMHSQGGSGSVPEPDIDTTRTVGFAATQVTSGVNFMVSGPHHPGEIVTIQAHPSSLAIRSITFSDPRVVGQINGNVVTALVPQTTANHTNISFIVEFAQPENQHQINVGQSAGGFVWASHTGQVQQGTHINIEAFPNRGYIFTGWRLTGATIPGASGQNQHRFETFVMPNNNVTVSARFERDPNWEENQNNAQNQLGANRSLTVQAVTPTNAGRVELPAATGNTATQQQQAQQTRQIRANDDVLISAVPNQGFEFYRWVVVQPTGAQRTAFERDNDLNSPDIFFRMPNFNLTLRPEFRAVVQTLGLTVSGGTGPTTFTPGSTVTVNATVPTGQRFVRWEVSGINLQANALQNANMSFIVPATQNTNIIVLAVFEPEMTQPPTQPTTPPTTAPTQPTLPPVQQQFNVMTQTQGNGSVFGTGVRHQGTQVTLVATADVGHRFVRWELISGGAVINAPTNASLTFTMPSQDVSFRAVFEQEAISGSPSGNQHQQPETTTPPITMPPVIQQPLPPSEQSPAEIQNGMNLPDTSDPVSLTLVFSGLAAISSFILFKPKEEEIV